MENSSLKTLLAAPEETEEPCPKKFKTDSNQVTFEKGQQQLLEIHCEDTKLANKFLCFPNTLWNFNQHNLEFQEKSSTNLKTSVRQQENFKMYMNVNLQSRLLGDIPYIGKWPPNSCITIRNASCKFQKNNSDLTKLKSLVSYVKETVTKTVNIPKANEWPTRGIFFYIILTEKFMARIESLFGDVPEFQNTENSPSCCPVCKMLKSEEQYLSSKPVRSDENSNEEVLKFCLPVKYFMNRRKSDSGSLIYEYKPVLHNNSDILSCAKQKRFSRKNNFRRNKVFQHRYSPYSRNLGNLDPKLAKGIAFELFLQSKKTCHSTVTENGTLVRNHIIQLNHQQTEKCNEEDTKVCLLCPTDIREDDIFSIVCYGKKQIASQIILSNDQILPDKNFSIILWKRNLYIPETIHNLPDNFRLLNYFISIPILFKKSNIKHLKPEMVTMEQFIQKKNRKACNQINYFSSKKIKHSYFGLRAHNKCENRRFRNGINCTSNNKYVPKYIEICSKVRMNKTQYGYYKHGQNNPCNFIDRKSHFDTYKKICLSSYSEEIEHISVLGNVITDEKYSKGCIIADKRFTSNRSETLTYICVPPELCTNYSSHLKESKSKKSQYFKDSRWLNQEISGKLFPINSRRLLKLPLDISQYFTPDMFHNLCLNQNIAICVEAKQSKTSLCGKRAKQSCFEFEKLKSVLQYQYQTTWISQVSKAPKAKKIGNVNFLGGKNILFSGTLMSERLSVNQNAEDVNKEKNAIAEHSYINKRNQYQNLCELYFKEESAKSVNSVEKLTASCSTKQKSFEDPKKGHFSSETNRRDQFDLVLEELRMFNEISKENENSLSQAKINILEKEPLVLNFSDSIPDQVNRNIHQNSVISTTRSCVSGVKQNRYKKSLFKQIIQSGEPEITHDYCSSSLSDEELFCSSSEEPAHCKQYFPWNPAFISQTRMKEGSYNLTTERGNCLLSGIIRVQPLKTCCGPLRVGLSRKAKLKQLHPYLK